MEQFFLVDELQGFRNIGTILKKNKKLPDCSLGPFVFTSWVVNFYGLFLARVSTAEIAGHLLVNKIHIYTFFKVLLTFSWSCMTIYKCVS